MFSQDPEFNSDNGYSVGDELEKIGFLGELESRSPQYSFFQRICSARTLVTTLPWLLVVALLSPWRMAPYARDVDGTGL